MSAFDDWWKTYQVDEESDSTGVIPKDAFNAGLEAAAEKVEQRERKRFDVEGNPMIKEFTPYFANAIRAEIEENNDAG